MNTYRNVSFFVRLVLGRNLSMKAASWIFRTLSSSALALFFPSPFCKTANRLARLLSENGRTNHPVDYSVKEQLAALEWEVPLMKSSPTFMPGSFLISLISFSPPPLRFPSEEPLRARNNHD